MNQLFIGVWNHREKDGTISDKGGVFTDKNGNVMFNLQILNSLDKEYREEQIHVFPNELAKMGFQDNYYDDEETRKETLRNYLEKKIFIFKIDDSELDNLYAYDVREHIKNNDFSIDDTFEEIPIYLDNRTDSKELTNKLLAGETIRSHTVSMLSVEEDSISSFMLSKDEESNWILYEDVTAISTDGIGSIQYQKPDNNNPITLRKLNNDSQLDNYYYDNGDSDYVEHNIMFVPTRYLRADRLEKFATRLTLLKEKDESEKIDKNQDPDLLFLDQFNEVLASSKYQLLLDDDDIVKLHTSIKSNLLTILAGLSGTGKSRILRAYAEALGMDKDSENRFKFISVKPSWQDDSDLLGFADTISNNYRPSDTGLVDTLIDAKRNSDQIYLIVLDEMNLSRIEYYFSQFLSVLERDSDERYLTLYSSYLEARLYNSSTYHAKILIPENVRFLGTMNIDESTFELSDKLIDRANIIELRTIPFYKLENMKLKKLKQKQGEDSWRKFQGDLLNYSSHGIKLDKRQLEFLWDLHEAINQALPNVGVSWRNVKLIEKFLNKLPSNYYEKIGKALDWQVSERILTKLRGTDTMLSNLISYDEKNEKVSGKIVDILDTYADLSAFEFSRELLLKKVRELVVNGYAR
ncbi:McrB family protein [Limosilactobacillus reuteri subsp. suis]|uniref:McrB family protein n=1 Tax=Limosilactobacillus reuteri TaxID=1598 RepID=UPI003994E124